MVEIRIAVQGQQKLYCKMANIEFAFCGYVCRFILRRVLLHV